MEDDGVPLTRGDKNRILVLILDVTRKHSSIYFDHMECDIRDIIDKSTVPGDANDLAFQEIFHLSRNYRGGRSSSNIEDFVRGLRGAVKNVSKYRDLRQLQPPVQQPPVQPQQQRQQQQVQPPVQPQNQQQQQQQQQISSQPVRSTATATPAPSRPNKRTTDDTEEGGPRYPTYTSGPNGKGKRAARGASVAASAGSVGGGGSGSGGRTGSDGGAEENNSDMEIDVGTDIETGSSSGGASSNIATGVNAITPDRARYVQKMCGVLRIDSWFPTAEDERVHDISDQSITVVLSNGGHKIKAQGLIVGTPELYNASVAGKVDLERNALSGAWFEQRLLMWGWGENDKVVTVRSDRELVNDQLQFKRKRQAYKPPKSGVLPARVDAEIWEEWGQLARHTLARDLGIRAWWNEFASFGGGSAPWAKQKREKETPIPCAVRTTRHHEGVRSTNNAAKAERAATYPSALSAGELRGLIPGHFSKLIGSIAVFDVSDRDHVPPQHMSRFCSITKFTATTSWDIDDMLKGASGKGETVPFPTVPFFQKPVPDAPGILEVRRLYNLGLMVGRLGPTLVHASLARIEDALGKQGFPDVNAGTFLAEVQRIIREHRDEVDTDYESVR